VAGGPGPLDGIVPIDHRRILDPSATVAA
jgi:hypothetical protein